MIPILWYYVKFKNILPQGVKSTHPTPPQTEQSTAPSKTAPSKTAPSKTTPSKNTST